MKTLFILGAGASSACGAPVMSTFLDRARDLLRLKTAGIEEKRAEFEDVFNAIFELQGVHSKSYLDLNNIEVVFGAIEMALVLGRLGPRNLQSIEKLRNSLITLIYRTLERSIKFPVAKGVIGLPEPYKTFMERLKTAVRNQPSQDPHEFSFITFNYDVCLDVALDAYGIQYDYFLEGRTKPGVTPLLKLHGSINWGIDRKEATPTIAPAPISQIRFNALGLSDHVYFNVGSLLNGLGVNNRVLDGPPVIVPPSWNKSSYHGQLSNVWAKASQELATAENIVVIGYSLPETDSFFRYLFALGTESPTTIRNFLVVNPDATVFERFKGLIGRGIESRFQGIEGNFSQALNQISDILARL